MKKNKINCIYCKSENVVSEGRQQYYCKNCGSNLLEQKNFNPNENFHICEKCGTALYSENIYFGERLIFQIKL